MRHAQSRTLLLAAAAALLPACGGGGGGGGTNAPSTLPPATTPPTTTLPPAGGSGPKLTFSVDRRSGKSPLTVAFRLCDSRDGSGGTRLTYLADFEESGSFQTLNGCGFTHVYRSNGVTVRDTRLRVQDANGRTDDARVAIKAYVDVAINVNKTTGCDKTVIATAQLLKTSSHDVRALADVDQVRFEAFNVAGQKVSETQGKQQGGDAWTTGTWNVNDNTRLRVRATVFARGIAGDNTPEDVRPECGG